MSLTFSSTRDCRHLVHIKSLSRAQDVQRLHLMSEELLSKMCTSNVRSLFSLFTLTVARDWPAKTVVFQVAGLSTSCGHEIVQEIRLSKISDFQDLVSLTFVKFPALKRAGLSTSCVHQVALESTRSSTIAFHVQRVVLGDVHSQRAKFCCTHELLQVPVCFLHCCFHFVQTSVMKQRLCELMSASGHRLVMRGTGESGAQGVRRIQASFGRVWFCCGRLFVVGIGSSDRR